MTDSDDYPPGTLAAELQRLCGAGRELKTVVCAEIARALTPLVDYMAKVGKNDRF